MLVLYGLNYNICLLCLSTSNLLRSWGKILKGPAIYMNPYWFNCRCVFRGQGRCMAYIDWAQPPRSFKILNRYIKLLSHNHASINTFLIFVHEGRLGFVGQSPLLSRRESFWFLRDLNADPWFLSHSYDSEFVIVSLNCFNTYYDFGSKEVCYRFWITRFSTRVHADD